MIEPPYVGCYDGHEKTFRRSSRVTCHPSLVTCLAFSLIEIMVTIALLSFIVLGLLAMFNQTQKAFRSSMTQVDVLEAGRAVTDMIARDMESMVASEMPDAFGTNGLGCTNFFAELTPLMTQGVLQGLPGTVGPGGAGTQDCRKNVFYDVFVLGKQNLDYLGIGYHVHPDDGSTIVGTLYRFMTNRPKSGYFGPSALGLSQEFRLSTNPPAGVPTAAPPKLSRIADGVVHFSIRAFDTNGFPFTYIGTTPQFGMFRTNGYIQSYGFGSGYAIMHNSRVTVPYASLADRYNYYFFSNAVPAYLELEVGFLEPHILDRLKGIGNAQAQYQYLSNHVANVHLFRRRIPIRNVDFLAYQ